MKKLISSIRSSEEQSLMIHSQHYILLSLSSIIISLPHPHQPTPKQQCKTPIILTISRHFVIHILRQQIRRFLTRMAHRWNHFSHSSFGIFTQRKFMRVKKMFKLFCNFSEYKWNLFWDEREVFVCLAKLFGLVVFCWRSESIKSSKIMRMLTAEEQSVDFFNLAVPSPFFKETEPIFFLLWGRKEHKDWVSSDKDHEKWKKHELLSVLDCYHVSFVNSLVCVWVVLLLFPHFQDI